MKNEVKGRTRSSPIGLDILPPCHFLFPIGAATDMAARSLAPPLLSFDTFFHLSAITKCESSRIRVRRSFDRVTPDKKFQPLLVVVTRLNSLEPARRSLAAGCVASFSPCSLGPFAATFFSPAAALFFSPVRKSLFVEPASQPAPDVLYCRIRPAGRPTACCCQLDRRPPEKEGRPDRCEARRKPDGDKNRRYVLRDRSKSVL